MFMFIFGTSLIFGAVKLALIGACALFAYKPLKAAGAYRFRGKTMLTVEGVSFLAVAVLSLLTFSFWLPALGVAAGVAIRMKGDNQRYLE